MSAETKGTALELTDGLQFKVGGDSWWLEPLSVNKGQWVALVPDDPVLVPNPAGVLAWILATMEEPTKGTVDLLGEDIYRMEYDTRKRLRSKIGFVHGYGGLLSNRTVADNIALPVSIYGGLSRADENRVVSQMIEGFSLGKVANLKPHEMDGATRWQVCLARALVLNPAWLVLEGLGNWEQDQGLGSGWKRLLEHRAGSPMAAAICLTSPNNGFEDWFQENDGVILRYTKYRESLLGT